MTKERSANWAAYATMGWAFAFAALSYYWAGGGTALADKVSPEAARMAEDGVVWFLALLWLVALLKTGIGVLALALVRPWGTFFPRWLLALGAWGVGAGMMAYGAGQLLLSAPVLAGAVVAPNAPAPDVLRWHVFVWQPIWLLGGLLLLVAAFLHQRHTGGRTVNGGAMPALGRDRACDAWLPTYQWRTAHSRLIRADKPTVAGAVRAVTPAHMLVLRPLVFIRSIQARFSNTGERYLGHNQPALTGLQEGVGAFTLVDELGGDVVVGFAGQPWGLRQHWVTLTPQEYRDFDEPHNIKGLMAFSVIEEREGTRLHTETRVYATDAGSVRKFRKYWLLIGPFSSLIWRDWLAAAARAAEKPTTA